jgi:ketosteroid isomerase-like protein
MRTWLVGYLVRRGFRRLGAGDTGPLLALFGAGARLVVPGAHSWSLDTTDRGEIAAWFRRFSVLRPQIEVTDVAVAGPPWNMRVFTRGIDRIDLPDGRVYRNRWCQFVRLAWGRVCGEDRIYFDTQRVAELDRMLAEIGS